MYKKYSNSKKNVSISFIYFLNLFFGYFFCRVGIFLHRVYTQLLQLTLNQNTST